MIETSQSKNITFNQKIRNRLFKQFLISLSVVILVIGAFLHYSSYSIVKKMVYQKAEVKTQLAYELLSHWIDEDSLAIKAFADFLSFQNLPKEKISAFIDYEKEKFMISTPFVAFTNGDFVINNWVATEGFDVRKRPWFIGSDNFYKDKKNLNSVYFSVPYISVVDSKFVFTMTAPIIKGEEYIGFAGLDVNIGELEKRMATIDDVMGSWFIVSEEGYLLLSGSNSNLVGEKIDMVSLGKVYSDMLENEKSDKLIINVLDRGEDTYFFLRDSVTRWVIAFRVNDNIIYSQVSLLNYGLLGGAILLLITFAAIILIVTSKFSKPIVRLAREAEKISEGNYACNIETNLRDELGYLTYRFNFMAKGLKEREEYERNQARLDSELQAGQNIQKSILPKELLKSKLFSSYAFYSSAREVGGDFYDYFKINRDCVVFCIGDVSGKGVPAALFMTMVCTLTRAICPRVSEPCEALERLNNAISEHNSENMFATIFLAYYNTLTGECVYANGGHNPVYIINSGKLSKSEDVKGMLIGGFLGVKYESGRFCLGRGDSVVMYTDGITEAHSDENELYGEVRMEQVLHENSSKSVNEIGEALIKDVASFQDQEQFDDITLLLWHRD